MKSVSVVRHFFLIGCPGIFLQVRALAIGLSSFHSFTQELKVRAPYYKWLMAKESYFFI
uniref:Uncharacterized protein n=1 Tax=Utricularia reniformis TaxID=192314 RepID=A0A1Y0B3P2_9LAMI|nr:hypothetical protein AEK19_MT0860 [Utricularia reniformis]YP_009382275.1 hypothetical protein AEK19_MT1849 [Utricularia reniformis]ART31093.1 hypothetical protein AEK19_MT0860 [Utricularia reniformis]ART32018.1 hypothetical protein AEK19_MT1849 [Utricularia reniformis]